MGIIDSVVSALGIDAVEQGVYLIAAGNPRIDTRLPTLVEGIDDRSIASSVKSKLLSYYPEQHPVVLVTAAVVPDRQEVKPLTLAEIDRGTGFDSPGYLYLPPLAAEQYLNSFAALVRIIAKLRGPGGCPWR